MIGAFARKLGSRERVLQCEQTGDHAYAVRATSDDGLRASEGADAPPERFVERYEYDGGNVFLAPILDTLRAVLKRPRADADEQAANLSRVPHNE